MLHLKKSFWNFLFTFLVKRKRKLSNFIFQLQWSVSNATSVWPRCGTTIYRESFTAFPLLFWPICEHAPLYQHKIQRQNWLQMLRKCDNNYIHETYGTCNYKLVEILACKGPYIEISCTLFILPCMVNTWQYHCFIDCYVYIF